MKYVPAFTNELSRDRFERLCEKLGRDEHREDRYAVYGHLCAWYAKWGGDPEYDHGLLFDINEKRMGIWADWDEPLLFGRALVHAGYVKPLEIVFPAQLLRGRSGFVAMHGDGGIMLDMTYNGWHRDQPNANELVLFLTSRARRAHLSRQMGLSGDGLPPGWLDPPPSGEVPGKFRGIAGEVPGDDRPLAPAPRRLGDVRKNRTETTSNDEKQATGTPKSDELRDLIVTHRYDNPLLCLKAIDGADENQPLWIEAVQRDVGFVSTLLANMVETDDAWRKICNPAGVVMSKVLPHVQRLRRTQPRTGRSDERGRGKGAAA